MLPPATNLYLCRPRFMTFLTHSRIKPNIYICLFLSLTIFLFYWCFAVPAMAVDKPTLTLEDCGKCHAFQKQMVATSGGKHATEVGCLDCHPQHLPATGETIASCNRCHSDQPHFQLQDCLRCHADPHRPLVLLRASNKPEKKPASPAIHRLKSRWETRPASTQSYSAPAATASTKRFQTASIATNRICRIKRQKIA